MKKTFGILCMALVAVLTCVGFTSCSDDDDNKSIVGTWECYDEYVSADEQESIKMTLTFKKDNTGSIVEEWNSVSRATSQEVYTMNFSWSTTTDASGNDILRVSYQSGDKNTELFMGTANTALWTKQFVLTGKTLNIYGSEGVWVFNKK